MNPALLFLLQLSGIVLLANGLPSAENGLRLIKTSEEDPGQWVDEKEILVLLGKGVKFLDLTNFETSPRSPKRVVNEDAVPEEVRFNATVREAIGSIQVDRMDTFMREFTSHHNRYYLSTQGREAAAALFAKVQSDIDGSGYAGNATVRLFVHPDSLSPQPSVIARIEGSGDLAPEIVILGAHLDSVNNPSLQNAEPLPESPVDRRSPGADDNASGCVVLLETLNVLLESGFIPRRSIEFQWYAAEEVGLRGSGDIAKTYEVEGVRVAAMVNFDVVGWAHLLGELGYVESIGIHVDYSSAKLNQFLRVLIWEYLNFTTTDLMCEYACSDQVRFHQSFFPASFPSEPINTSHMHRLTDDLTNYNITFVQEFTKLGIAYAIEVSELEPKSSSAVAQLGWMGMLAPVVAVIFQHRLQF